MALPFVSYSVHGRSFNIGVHSKLGISNSNYIRSLNTTNYGTFPLLIKASNTATTTTTLSDQQILRRTANYHPPIWKDDFIQSLKSDYAGKSCNERASRLVEEVRMMLVENVTDPNLQKLELVDTLQRLGLSYHFDNEINQIMHDTMIRVADHINVAPQKLDHTLYATALRFRLLRQHGYKVTQEVFSSFLDEAGNFKASLCEDCQGLVHLYEASYLWLEGESILEKARDFAAKHLKEYVVKQKQNKLDDDDDDEYLSMLVDHCLELPLHWRVNRLEARWYIDLYERRHDRNPTVLELAKLDYNIVQAIHQDDLRFASKWWRDLGFGEKLPFARDRLMENFLWTIGVAFDPQFSNLRRNLTKVNALITTIDDVYDVYGTLDELQLFTQAVDRWDINATKLLPEDIKICFHGLYNSINSMAFDTLKEHGLDSIHFFKKMWADLCKSYLLEAKWYYSGYTPTLQEYLDNAWVSISAPVLLAHLYVMSTNSTRKDCLEYFDSYSNIIYCSSLILRLADDLGTSSDELKRGDVPKSIQCYMHESGASEEEAREHIRKLIDATWRRMNEGHQIPHSQTFIRIAMNLARMAQCMYQHGDGHGIEVQETKDRVLSLLVLPIPN